MTKNTLEWIKYALRFIKGIGISHGYILAE